MTPCKKLLLHHIQNGTDIIVLYLLVLKTPSIHLQPNSTHDVALLTNFPSFFPSCLKASVSRFFTNCRNMWQHYWIPWAKFCISSSNMILNSGYLSEFIEARVRKWILFQNEKCQVQRGRVAVWSCFPKLVRDTSSGMAHILCFS